jgi:hypothetical protein
MKVFSSTPMKNRWRSSLSLSSSLSWTDRNQLETRLRSTIAHANARSALLGTVILETCCRTDSAMGMKSLTLIKYSCPPPALSDGVLTASRTSYLCQSVRAYPQLYEWGCLPAYGLCLSAGVQRRLVLQPVREQYVACSRPSMTLLQAILRQAPCLLYITCRLRVKYQR